MINLVHIDIPDSVTAIMSDAFAYCSSLSLTSLNNVVTIGATAFRGANTMITDISDRNSDYISSHALELQIGGGYLQIGSGAFNNSGWQRLIIGRPGNGVTSRLAQGNSIHSGSANCVTSFSSEGSNTLPVSAGNLEQIVIYSTVETINDYNGVQLSRLPSVEVIVEQA